MPQFDPKRNLYFNVAVLLGPTGKVEGVYKKRNNLIESSYNALYFGKMRLRVTFRRAAGFCR
jgi:hypothetical protein